MATVFENAAATIAALGTDAGGCNCVYYPQNGTGIPLSMRVASRPVMPAVPGRGPSIGETQRRMIVTFMLDASLIPAGTQVKAGDFFDVPGHKVGKPGEALVKVGLAGKTSLVEGKYWTGELAV